MTDIEAEKMLEQARSLVEEGKKEEARICLLNLLKDEPKSIAALLMLGGSYFEENNFKEAKLVFQQLIKISPGVGLYSIALFNALWRLKETDEALKEIRRFILHADKDAEKETIAQYLSTLSAMENNNQTNVVP
ncbi:MAG TPA: tetratricopeptide repeat protein [Gammaproteobacteria bacterium]|nr:tetratricopeptide repeat protein [Gammaproteobacteria bacterium]